MVVALLVGNTKLIQKKQSHKFFTTKPTEVGCHGDIAKIESYIEKYLYDMKYKINLVTQHICHMYVLSVTVG